MKKKKKKKKWTEDGLKNHKWYYAIKNVKPIEDKEQVGLKDAI